MSRSIIFNGHDFGDVSSCDVTPAGFCGVSPEVVEVVGRPGKAVLSGNLLPLAIGVRLYLDAGCVQGFGGVSAVRRSISSWLATSSGVLVLPEEPSLEWHDVVCTGGTAWSSPGSDAWCDLTFIAYDPVAYGAERVFAGSETLSVEIEGTWETRPTLTLSVLADCDELVLTAGDSAITLTGGFAEGDVVVVDCANEHVTLNGTGADIRVADGSSYPVLVPGTTVVACPNAAISATMRERWV